MPSPNTPEACERLLDYLEQQRALGADDLAAAAVRYLGATGPAWTRPRRRRLGQLLLSIQDGLREVLATVFEAPTAEVMADAVECLHVGASPERRDLYAAVLEGEPIAIAGVRALRESPDVRIVLAKALSRLAEPLTEAEQRGLLRAAADGCADVREAAVVALARRGGPSTRDLLLRLKRDERSDAVRQTIDEMLAERA